MGDAAGGLLPDLGAGGAIVRFRILLVVELFARIAPGVSCTICFAFIT